MTTSLIQAPSITDTQDLNGLGIIRRGLGRFNYAEKQLIKDLLALRDLRLTAVGSCSEPSLVECRIPRSIDH